MRPDAFVYRSALAFDTRCRRCGDAIAPGDPVMVGYGDFATRYLNYRARDLAVDGRGDTLAYHFRCSVDVNPVAAMQALKLVPPVIAQRDALMQLATARTDALTAAARPRGRAKKSATAIEPTTDPRGRPRVRALLLAPNVVLERRGETPLAQLALDPEPRLTDLTLASSLREYVLVRHADAVALEPDPTQPLVAGVLWQRAHNAIGHHFRGRLVEWCALGLAPPVLVVVGPEVSEPARADAIVQKLRALLESVGFEPDHAPVVCAPAIDRAFVEALADALDRCVAGRIEAPKHTLHDGVIAHFEAVVTQGRAEAFEQAARRAIACYQSASPLDQQRILRSIVQGADTPAKISKIASAFEHVVVGLPRATLTVLAMRLLEARTRLPPAFDAIVDYWRVGSGDTAPFLQLLVGTIREHPQTERAARCIAVLAREGDVSLGPALLALIEDLGALPAVQTSLRRALEQIEAQQ